MRKQFLLVAMCLCLALSTSFPTLAANVNDGTVMPMAQECGNCGKMTLNVSVTYGIWEDTSTTVTCSKYSTRKDIVQKRDVYTKYTCTSCGYTKTVTTTQKRTYCSH